MKKRIIIILSIVLILITILLTTKLVNENDIPKIYFEGDISNMTSKEDVREILLKYRSEDVSFDKNIKIKVQGTSSLAFEKKNYTINFYEDSTYNNKEKVDVGYGWGAQSEYCLKANWIDKTHARNIVSARIIAKVQKKYEVFQDAPNNGMIDGFPVEIYINGEFLGLYTMNIPKDAWMWSMDEENPNHMVLGGDDYTNSTLLAVGANNFEEAGWDVEVGKETSTTIDNFNRLIKFINNSTDEEFINNFDQYFDKDSTINYLILMHFMQAEDNRAKNMMLVTYDGKVWYPSLYDLDSTWGTTTSGTKYDTYLKDLINVDFRLWSKVTRCFGNEIADRYFELRKDILKKENILKEFKNFTKEIPNKTFRKENEKWKEIPGCDIEQIEEFLNIRIPYMDDMMNDIKNNK